MKRQIKVKFIDFEPYFPPAKQPFYELLSRHYDICETDRPDYIIDRGLSFKHVKYNDCIKILFLGENYVPDFNSFDYAIGFDYLTFGDRYIRHPLFARYASFAKLAMRTTTPDPKLLDRKFCSFVVSNSQFCDPMRRKFFERLSKYKKVDSGGRFLNNIGGPVKDKIEFCRGYKFNIAFENSSSPGYTTEKIMEAYVAQTVPIYYGNPTVDTDFRPDSMVRVVDEDDIERAVEEVIRLDSDDSAYMEKVTACCLAESDITVYDKRLEGFLSHIFDQPLETARRRNRYGHQAMMENHMKTFLRMDCAIRSLPVYRIAAKLKGWFDRRVHR